MVDAFSANGIDNRSRNLFRSWDAFDRIFDEALSRPKSPLSPDIVSPTPMRFPEPHQYAHAGATPYAPLSPAFPPSDEDFGISGAEEQDRDDPFDRIWNEGLRKTRRSTVTTSKTVRRSKHILESSASNSTSTSNDTSPSSSGPPAAPSAAPPREPVTSPRVKKRKSKVSFKDSADGRAVTVTFDLPGIQKSDVHVSYQNDKVVVSWESVSIEEKVEGNRVIRDRREKRYVRTLPLPEGTRFEQVKASMDGRRLMLTYPKFTERKPVQVIEIKTE